MWWLWEKSVFSIFSFISDWRRVVPKKICLLNYAKPICSWQKPNPFFTIIVYKRKYDRGIPTACSHPSIHSGKRDLTGACSVLCRETWLDQLPKGCWRSQLRFRIQKDSHQGGTSNSCCQRERRERGKRFAVCVFAGRGFPCSTSLQLLGGTASEK